MNDLRKVIEKSLHKLEKWVEDRNYKAYDPFDGLNSILRPLTFNNEFAERLLEQIVRQSPLNLRPLIGIKPDMSTKGIGFMAWGYINMFKCVGGQEYKGKALRLLDWLDVNKAAGYRHHSWGNHFDWTSRSGRQPKGEPDIVWTGLIGQTFLDAYELFKETRHLEVVKSINEWMKGLSKERTEKGTCLSYLASSDSFIHNSNMVGAGYLARSSIFSGDISALKIAEDSVEYTCSRQLSDGSWFYGEEPNKHWIDNFHTAYNLDSLKCYINVTGDKTFEQNLRKGFIYWKDHFFEETGRPKYYSNRTYPVDSQCASQAIDTLTNFSDRDGQALELACKVADWTIKNMQDKDGHFYYRQYPLGIKAKAPMLHWAQATMYKALTHLMLKMTK